MELKDRIKEAMAHAKLSAAALSRATGKTGGAVTQWLDGTTKSIKGDTAAKLQDATGYNASWLATGKGDKLPTPQSTSPAPGALPSPFLTAQDAVNPDALINALCIVAKALQSVTEAERDAVSRKLASLAMAPDSTQLLESLNNALKPIHSSRPSVESRDIYPGTPSIFTKIKSTQ